MAYIDRDKLLHNLPDDLPYKASVKRVLMCAEEADAVEVIHGEWILETEFEDGKADYKCSVCDYDDTFYKNLVEHFYKYCPWCGAKMDGGMWNDL